MYITQRIKQKGCTGQANFLLSISVFSWDKDVHLNPFRFHTLNVTCHFQGAAIKPHW
jgi:hypothetical protein